MCRARKQLVVAPLSKPLPKALLLAEGSSVDAAKVRHALLGGFAGSKTLEVHGQRLLNWAFAPGFRVPLQSQGRPHRGVRGCGDRDVDAAVTQLQGAVEAGDGALDHNGPYAELVREADLS